MAGLDQGSPVLVSEKLPGDGRQGQDHEGIQELEHAVELSPDNLWAHRNLGASLMRQGKAYRPRGRAVWKVDGLEVEIIHVRPLAFFGHQKVWVSSWNQVAITDPERTALDFIARPEVFGGLSAALDILEEILLRLELQNMIRYGLDYQIGAVIKRLGWSLENMGVSTDLLTPLQQYPVRNVTLLDPRAPASTVTNARWQINENLRGK